MEVENSFINYFNKKTEIYQGMKLIDEKLGGTTPLEVILRFPVTKDEEKDIENDWGDEEENDVEEEHDDSEEQEQEERDTRVSKQEGEDEQEEQEEQEDQEEQECIRKLCENPMGEPGPR